MRWLVVLRYGTFSELAGIDPTDWRAAAADLPPVDSHSLVPVLMGTGQSTRKEIPIGTEPRLMKMYGHENQVSTIQGAIGVMWSQAIKPKSNLMQGVGSDQV